MADVVYYEARFKTALCRLCKTGVVVRNKKARIDHFRHQPHFLKGVPLQHVQQYLDNLELVDVDDVPYPSRDTQPVPAVPCLPVHRAFDCEQCDRGPSVNAKNARAHASRVHGTISGRDNRGLRVCHVQTLFREKKSIRYFCVQPVSDTIVQPNPTSDHFDAAVFSSTQAKLVQEIHDAEVKAVDQVPDCGEHPSSIIPWVHSCGFDRHYQGFDQKTVRVSYQLPSTDQDGDEDGRLVSQVASRAKMLLEETWSWCVDGPQCRLTRPMAVSLSQFWAEATVHSKGFRAGISEAARKEYFQLWAGCIVYYWKVSTKRALTRPRCAGMNGANELEGEKELEAENDEKNEKDDESLCRGTEQQRATLDQCLNDVANMNQDNRLLDEHILQLSLALIQQKLPRSRFESPVLSYCAAMAANYSTKGWKEPGNFNKSLSGLIYCAQLWILRETCRVVDAKGYDADDVLRILCEKWMRQERSTTYGIILNWRLMLFSVAKQVVSSKLATWSLDGAEVCYQGTAIRMEHITQLYHRTLDRAQIILDRDLLLGADHLPRMSSTALFDGEHQQDVSWWFALDSRNKALLKDRDTQLIDHIRSTPKLREAFLDEHGQWRAPSMRLYEHHIQLVLECFVVLMHLFPAKRGSEVYSLTWRNTAKLRSFLLKHGRVMVYTTYHKGQAQWGTFKDNIHFLPTRLGNLLLDFLVYVQGLRRIFLWQQHGRLMSSFLWTRDGELWTDGSLTHILRKACAAAEVPALSVSHWRQICATVVKTKFGADRQTFSALTGDTPETDGADEDDGEDEDVAVLARLSNHTVRTHNRAYANATGLVAANVWDGLIKRSFRACMLWSQFFRFEEDVAEAVLGRKRSRSVNNDDDDDDNDDDNDRGMMKRVALAVPPVKQHWSGRALLQEARKLYRDPGLQWRCAEQEQAACAVVSKVMEVLVVMATGMGKTLLFQLPCCLPGARTTVLVVPLVALTVDLLRRCHELGIDCQEWAKNHHSRASLVIVSAEAAVSEAGRAYLYELQHAGQLDRIVFDECHLICTTSVYRRVMPQLALLRSIPVQCVYLTATMPLSLREELYHRHYLSQVTEIRASTRRTNIAYRVHRLARRDTDIVRATATYLQTWWARQFSDDPGSARAIIFARTKRESDDLGKLLSCSSYHADSGDAAAKARTLADWMSPHPQSCFLVGTSGLGAGLDYAHVRLTLHMDEPYGLINFAQESGRAGRDRVEAESVVIIRQAWQPRPGHSVSDDERRLHLYLTSTGCRRVHIDNYLDGQVGPATCNPGEACCDSCRLGKGVARNSPTSAVCAPESTAAGPQVMLQQVHRDTQDLADYESRLVAVKDQCLMCRLREKDTWAGHDFTSCRESYKWQFIHTKREVLAQSRQSWVRKYDACFRCFQPQELCVPNSSRKCQFADLVMQGVFTVFGHNGYRCWLEQTFHVSFDNAIDCLRWAGEPAELGRVRCVQGVRVLAQLLQRLEPPG